MACFTLQPCGSWESSDLSCQLRNHTQLVILTSSPTLQAQMAPVAPVNMINRSHLNLIILGLTDPASLCQRGFELSCDASSLFLQTAASMPCQKETQGTTRAHLHVCIVFLGKKGKEKQAVARFPTLKCTFFQDSCSIPTEQTLQFMRTERMVEKKTPLMVRLAGGVAAHPCDITVYLLF